MAYQRKGSILPIMGLDTSKPAEYITDQNSPNCYNIDIDHSVIRKRNGIVKLGDTQVATIKDILGGREFNVGDSKYAVRVGADKAEVWDGANSEWDSISSSTLASNADSEVALCTPTLSGSRILVWTSGEYAPQKYTGTGNHADLGGTPPYARYCENFGAYTLLSHITNDGGSTYRNRVQWSDTGLPETWTGGNSGYADLLDGTGDITGIKRFGNYLTIHKTDVIYLGYLVSSTSVFKFNKVYTPGTVCNSTVQMLPNGFLAYLSIDGIRLFNGTTSELVGANINEDLKDEINFLYIHRAWSMVVQQDNEYWIGVPTGSDSYANTIYRFNYVTGNMYRNTYGVNLRSGFLFSNTINKTWDNAVGTWDSAITKWNAATGGVNFPIPIISTDDGDSYAIDYSVSSDNSGAINAVFETKDYTSETQGQLVRWLQMEVWAKGNSISVSYSTDKGITWYDIDTLALDSSYPNDDAPLFCFFDVVSSRIRFKFYNNTADSTFTLKQFIIRCNPREYRGQ